jgi:hypothetical protein
LTERCILVGLPWDSVIRGSGSGGTLATNGELRHCRGWLARVKRSGHRVKYQEMLRYHSRVIFIELCIGHRLNINSRNTRPLRCLWIPRVLLPVPSFLLLLPIGYFVLNSILQAFCHGEFK